MSDENVKTIQDIYAAFGRGDVGAILERVSDDTEWGFAGASDAVPWHAPARGRSGVERFIGAFMSAVDLKAFEPRAFIHSGGDVVVHIHLAYTVKSSGCVVDEEQLQWWSLAGAKVRRLRHFEDTAQVVAANA